MLSNTCPMKMQIKVTQAKVCETGAMSIVWQCLQQTWPAKYTLHFAGVRVQKRFSLEHVNGQMPTVNQMYMVSPAAEHVQ